MKITYVSDPVPGYNAAITAAKDRDALQDAIEPFSMIAADALKTANGILKCIAVFVPGRHGRTRS